jgi:Uncharacterized protein conserved in bacteria (DUF2147)
MKRLCGLIALMLISTSAEADTISFSVGGHRIRIEAPNGCRSSTCASVSIPGVYQSRSKREDDKRDVVASPSPAPAPAQVVPPPAPAPVQQSAPPAPKPVVATAPAPAPVAVYKPAAVATQEVAPPPLPPVPQPPQPVIVTQPCTTPPARTDDAVRPAPASPPPMLKVLHEEDPDSPLGDWQTEGKGMVRIAECGRSLCGYAIKEGESEKGEAILINMKPKSDAQWSGSVYSKDSGDTYYGTMRLKGPNMLRVEACAFSRFYCNGSNWTRVTEKPMVTSRQVSDGPRT